MKDLGVGVLSGALRLPNTAYVLLSVMLPLPEKTELTVSDPGPRLNGEGFKHLLTSTHFGVHAVHPR
jgi:hypothetical protein